MIILGLDPGLATTGYGGIQCKGPTPSLITCGSIKTSPQDHVSRRIFQIHTDINTLIHSLRPDLIAVENAFSLVRYPRAGILLGGVLGIIYLSVFTHKLAMVELTPREVKKSLSGYGAADKFQIKSAVKRLLYIKHIQSSHASDALAIALTAYYRKSFRGKR
jgi:crossover junction endodeoxyribonuclease RuvC